MLRLGADVITGAFLMYRVELKDNLETGILTYQWNVPNVPCGVESI